MLFEIYKKCINRLYGSGLSKLPGVSFGVRFIAKKLKPEYVHYFGNKICFTKNTNTIWIYIEFYHLII